MSRTPPRSIFNAINGIFLNDEMRLSEPVSLHYAPYSFLSSETFTAAKLDASSTPVHSDTVPN